MAKLPSLTRGPEGAGTDAHAPGVPPANPKGRPETGGRAEKRSTLVALLASRPGSTIQDVADSLACTHPTASYHLNALVRMGLIVREREGRVVRHYPSSTGPAKEAKMQAILGQARARAAIEYLVAHEKSPDTVNRIAGRLGLPYGYTKRLLAYLEKNGWVRLERRDYRYQVRVLPTLLSMLKQPPAGRGPPPGLA